MQPTSTDNIVAVVTGPKGDPGDATSADIATAIAALTAGVDPSGNTLAKLLALILLRAPLDGAALTNATVTTQSSGNNSTKPASTAFTQQALTNLAATVLALTGGTMLGPLLLAADPVSALQAATKQYVDALIQGISNKYSATCATAAALPTNTYNNGTSGVGATLTATANGALAVDGQSPPALAYLLVKNEATAAHNGLYSVTQAGDSTHPYILTRALDDDAAAEMAGAFCFVELGTVNNSTGWVCGQSGVTLGTTAVAFTQFSGAGTYTAGAALSLTGGQFAVSDPELLALAGLVSATDNVPYFTGSGTAALAPFTAFARTLAACATAAAVKTALALAVADISGAAPLASPNLTGTPAAPTAAVDTNSTQIATQAAILQQAASATPLVNGVAAAGTSTRFARGDHVHPTDTTKIATVKKQTFASSNTYTPSTGMLYCIIECWGGGGAGGGAATGSTVANGGGGGGSGGYSRLLASAAAIGANKAVTIGAPGAPGTAGANNGGNGGDTSVGTLCIAKGGSGGSFGQFAGGGAGGAGGVAGTGDDTFPGQCGSASLGFPISTANGLSGMGGSIVGGAGASVPGAGNATQSAGSAAVANSGAGGSGATCSNGTVTAGGAGGSGYVRIVEFCSA